MRVSHIGPPSASMQSSSAPVTSPVSARDLGIGPYCAFRSRRISPVVCPESNLPNWAPFALRQTTRPLWSCSLVQQFPCSPEYLCSTGICAMGCALATYYKSAVRLPLFADGASLTHALSLSLPLTRRLFRSSGHRKEHTSDAFSRLLRASKLSRERSVRGGCCLRAHASLMLAHAHPSRAA